MDCALPGSRKFTYTGDIIPKHLVQYVIPNAQRRYKLFFAGELLTQVMLGTNYSIWLHYWFISKNCILMLISEQDILTMSYMFMGDISCDLSGFGKVHLRHNRYGFFYVPGRIYHKAKFKPGIYCCVHIDFHSSILKPVAKYNPIFRPGLILAEQKSSHGTSQEQSIIYPYIKKLIDEILYCNFGPGERILFIESQIRILLRLYLKGQGSLGKEMTVTNYQLETIGNIEKFMQQHLSEKLTVTKVAKEFNVSRSWLQRICHNYFGMGVHELLTEKRMEVAAELLLTTNKQIGQIATEVTPLSFSAFTAAFVHHFKQTPSAFRRNKGQKRQRMR